MINHQLWAASIADDGATAVPIGPVHRSRGGTNPFWQAVAPDGQSVVVFEVDTHDAWLGNPKDGTPDDDRGCGSSNDPPTWQRVALQLTSWPPVGGGRRSARYRSRRRIRSPRVERARRHEPEALVEAVRTTLAHVWLVKSSVAPSARMSSTTRSTMARPMPRPWWRFVHDQLPQEPRTDDVGRLRRDVPAEHHEPDRLTVQVDGAIPRAALGILGSLLDRVGDR